jgi:hypothetical protein
MNRKPSTSPNSEPGTPGRGEISQLALNSHLRYVVLHHSGVLPEHFDLLLEPPSPPTGQLLLTWRIEIPPGTWSTGTAARRQPDHRPVYMEYEGEISGNRGRVRRVAAGTAVVLEVTRSACRLELQGDLRCRVHLPL